MGERRTGLRLMLGVTGCLVALGAWLLFKGTATNQTAKLPAPQESGATGSAGELAGQRSEGNSTSSDLTPGVSALADALIERGGVKGPDLNEAIQGWIAQEQELIREISAESFERTLEMSGDWETNYCKLVVQNDPMASTPDGLVFILHSRRFAKMLEETAGGMSQAQVSALVARLDADIRQWEKLSKSGQSLRGQSVRLGGPTYKTEDLIFPLTMRINAAILLAGERSVREALPLVLKSVEVTGVDTNWSGCAYACDKILTSAAKEEPPAAQSALLRKYVEWKAGLKNKRFSDYKVLEVPSYKSAQRPNERATSMGAPVDAEKGTIHIEMPPICGVLCLREPQDGSPYEDLTNGTTDGAMRIVEYAREFADAGK